MIKKTVKYEDFNGNQVEESYFFHMTKGDLIDWAAEEDGGLVDRITEITKEDNPAQIIPIIKKILLKSYGIKSEDGKSFIKRPEDVENFQYTEAFSELYTELSTDPDKTVEFIEGILPKFDEETKKAIEEAKKQFEAEREKTEDK